MQAGAVLKYHLLVNRFVFLCEFNRFSLEHVVKFLRASKKCRRALNHSPSSFDTHCVHEQSQWRQNLRNASAVECGTYMDNARSAQFLSFLQNSLCNFTADQSFVALERM